MRKIPLTQDKFTIIDDEDYDFLSQFKWCAAEGRHTFYALTTLIKEGKRKNERMHRLLMNPKKDEQIDHIDGDGLNNRRNNLRICTIKDNVRNARPRGGISQYKGVRWHKRHKKWYGQIKVNYHRFHLGCFDCEIEAAKSYDEAAKKYFGKFANLNFPKGK